MIVRPLAFPVIVLLALGSGSCKREPAPDATAAGQILPGSASDAMLPADRVTSQPPLDPRADRAAGAGDKPSATEAAGAEAGPAPAAEGTAGAD